MNENRATTRPNFFIVGAPKCGTTAMYEYLRQHPDIFMSEVKEPHFFASDTTGPRAKLYNLDQYLALFAEAGNTRRIGEATPAYLISKKAAQEIKDFAPQAKIIIMLRSPVELVYSAYQHRRAVGRESAPSLREALKIDHNRGENQPIALSYWKRTLFTEPVQRYFEVFGRDNVLVIIYDDFKHNTADVYQNTLKFLGVDPYFQPEFEVINASKQVRSSLLQKLLILFRATPMNIKYSPLGRVFSAIPTPIRTRVAGLLRTAYMVEKRPPPMDTELRQQLQQAFLPEVQRLSNLLGRDLTYWCRD